MTSHTAFFDTPVIDELALEALPSGRLFKARLNMVTDQLGDFIQIPVLVLKGRKPGRVIGLTAAIHGDELNGTLLIHRLIKRLDPDTLSGTVIAIPVLNIPGFKSQCREYWDGSDLNRLMPGKAVGMAGEVYAYRLMQKVISKLDYLLDFHTASMGRVNSLHVRGDFNHPAAKAMALTFNPSIVINSPKPAVNTKTSGTTLRSAALDLGIPAITIEIGNPSTFQNTLIEQSIQGLLNIFRSFGFVENTVASPDTTQNKLLGSPVICHGSYWLRSEAGGLLEVYPGLTDVLQSGDKIATLRNALGDVIQEYVFTPTNEQGKRGIVVGKAVNPVCLPGSRIVHIGKVQEA